jgi:hypothetical protein
MIRWVFLMLSVVGLATTFALKDVSARQKNGTAPTMLSVRMTGPAFDLRISHDAFAPLAIATPPGKGTGVNGNVGSLTLVLCQTVTPPNPQAEFLLGNDKVYATIGTPVGALTVSEIDDGRVVFDDGSVIAESTCTTTAAANPSGLPHPDLTLQSGSTGLSPGGIVPAPGGNVYTGAGHPYTGGGTYVAPSPQSQLTPAPLPSPFYNNYTTPQPGGTGVPPILILPSRNP